MLDGAAACLALGQDSAARCIDHVFGDRFDDRLSFQVNALYFIAVVFGGGVEGYRQAEARVQAFAEEGETAPQGLLLIHSRLNICCLPRGAYLFLLVGFQRFQFFFHSVKFAVHLG